MLKDGRIAAAPVQFDWLQTRCNSMSPSCCQLFDRRWTCSMLFRIGFFCALYSWSSSLTFVNKKKKKTILRKYRAMIGVTVASNGSATSILTNGLVCARSSSVLDVSSPFARSFDFLFAVWFFSIGFLKKKHKLQNVVIESPDAVRYNSMSLTAGFEDFRFFSISFSTTKLPFCVILS